MYLCVKKQTKSQYIVYSLHLTTLNMSTFQQKLVSAAQRGVIFVPGFGLTTEAEYAQISQVPTLVRQTNDGHDTTAREECSCCSCHEPVMVGDRITQIDSMGAAALVAGGIPLELQEMISACVGIVEETHHAECAGINQTTTRSGRVSRAPVRLQDEKFVAGSGFGGCDHYDSGYNRGVFYGSHLKPYNSGANLHDFVVADEELAPPAELPDDEEEWNSDDAETSDEEEFDMDDLCDSDCD